MWAASGEQWQGGRRSRVATYCPKWWGSLAACLSSVALLGSGEVTKLGVERVISGSTRSNPLAWELLACHNTRDAFTNTELEIEFVSNFSDLTPEVIYLYFWFIYVMFAVRQQWVHRLSSLITRKRASLNN